MAQWRMVFFCCGRCRSIN